MSGAVVAAPAFGRRHELGAASARSLLLTVLGELVLPAAEPVWTSALLAVLGRLGVEPKTARQALARTAAEGWLEPRRAGRRTSWALTPAGSELLATGARRIYRHAQDDGRWAGDWLVVLATLTDVDRRLRHRLRTRLAWSGLGRLAPGVWIGTHVDRQRELRRALEDAGVAGSVTTFVSRLGELGDPVDIARRAWDLDDVSAAYGAFIVAVREMNPRGDAEKLLAQLRLVQEWRRFPFVDPDLPAELLPQRWDGHAAAALFARRHGGWQPAANREWQRLRRS